MWTGYRGGAGTYRSGAVELLGMGFEGWVLHRGHLSDVGYSPRGGELRGDGRGILEGTGGLWPWNWRLRRRTARHRWQVV